MCPAAGFLRPFSGVPAAGENKYLVSISIRNSGSAARYRCPEDGVLKF